MTVAELISHLQKYPGDMLVILSGHESGYEDARIPEQREIAVNFNRKQSRKEDLEDCPWWKGIHEATSEAKESDIKKLRCKVKTALLLH